jgi:glycerol-3-phosphate dehydrogenase
MKITIIGRGNVGGALQRVLSASGHDVDAWAATEATPAVPTR